MAHIYKRGGIWWGRVQRDGKLRRHSLKTASKALARKRLTKWIAKLEGLNFGEKEDHSFDEAALKFTAEHLPTLKPKSALRYNVSIDALVRSFEGVALSKVTSSTLLAFVNMRREDGVKPPTIRRDLNCLSSIMGLAIEWEWIEANPVGGFLKRMKKRGLREAPARKRYLTHEEEEALLANASPHVARAITFAIDTGLRLEEQFSLRWPQLLHNRAEIEVDGSTSKNAKDRTVPMLPRAMTLTGALPRHIKLAYVFWHIDKRGRPKRYNNLERGLKAAARRAGIKNLRWHDLRRTCGCRLLQDHRFTMKQVSDWLGHSSVVVTEKAYAFLRIDQLHEAAGTKPVTASNVEGVKS